MSAEEDTELRDLVAQTLENNGILGKIKAQLRASIYLALEEQNSKENKIPLANKELKDFLNTKNGILTANLVREFLEYFNLEFTQAVYDPETNLDIHYTYKGRQYLCEEFGVSGDKKDPGPVLNELIKKNSFLSTDVKENTPPKTLTSQQLANAEIKYKAFDKANRDYLNKDETCDLFMEIFPNFSRNMIQQFVNDEFITHGKSVSSEINNEEFLSMYEQLFSLCRSVVMHDSLPFTPRNKVPTTMHQLDSDEVRRMEVPDEKGGGDGTQALISNDENLPPHEEKSVKNFQNEDSDHDDSFYDEPLNNNNNMKSNFSRSNPINTNYDEDFVSGLHVNNNNSNQSAENSLFNKTYDFKDNSLITLTRGGSLGSLKDAPPLTPAKDLPVSNWKDWEALDKRIADIGLGDDDYEEDFQLSLSARSDRKSGTDPSPDEEIEEDISGTADDLLNSSVSGVDDLTTDKTVSQISGASVDYLESLN